MIFCENAIGTITFKSVGTDAPNTHYLPERDSPSPPIQCWIVLSILLWCKIMRRLKKNNIEWMGEGRGETIHCKSLKHVQ